MEVVRVESQEQMPARTVLAPLPPHGVGTMFVESLSSYFQRLADQHSISPKLIAREFVLPRLGFNNRVGEVQADRYWRSSFFNGMGEVPEQWCRILGELTGVPRLRQLTLLPLHGLIGMHGCASATRRWCPRCLHESEAQGHPYGQLLWEIGCVEACPKHGIRLMAEHGCGADEAIPPLRIKPLPHLCRSCGRSLALPPYSEIQPADDAIVAFARAIGELLTSPLYEEHPREANRTIADFLVDAIQTVEDGFSSKAVRRIGASKGEVSDWLHRRHLPSLPQAARIACAYGVPLSDALLGRGGIRPTPYRFGKALRRPTFKPYQKRYMVPNVEEKLREFLTLPIPPSEAEAAGMVGATTKWIRIHHPDLCSAIARRRADWSEQEAHRRRDERLRVVEELVGQMVDEGVIPTIARLEARLVGIPKAFLFKERAACKQICDAAKAALSI